MNLKIDFIIYELTIVVNIMFYLLLFSFDGVSPDVAIIGMFVVHIFLGHFILLKTDNEQEVYSRFWMYTLNIIAFSVVVVSTSLFSGDRVVFYILSVAEVIGLSYFAYYNKKLLADKKRILMDVQPRYYWVFVLVILVNAILTIY